MADRNPRSQKRSSSLNGFDVDEVLPVEECTCSFVGYDRLV